MRIFISVLIITGLMFNNVAYGKVWFKHVHDRKYNPHVKLGYKKPF